MIGKQHNISIVKCRDASSQEALKAAKYRGILRENLMQGSLHDNPSSGGDFSPSNNQQQS